MSDDDDSDILIPGLLRSIALACLARVPRGAYSGLCLVSKSWYRALRPDCILAVRASEGISEPWLYITVNMGGPFVALDPLMMRWHRLPFFPRDPSFTDSDKECFVAGRELLVVGPSLVGHVMQPVIWRYGLGADSWIPAPRMLIGRSLFASASDSATGVAYVAGGVRFGSRVALRDAEVYCSRTARWRGLPPMHTARKECSGFVLDGCFYVIGGTDDQDRPVVAGERFDPVTRRWRVVAGLWPESSVERLRGGSVAPPLVAVVRDVAYAWDHRSGLLKRWGPGGWTVVDAVAGRGANEDSHGWGLGFKGVGDELWLIGGTAAGDIDACRPGNDRDGVVWRRVVQLGHNSFVFNCAVMKA